MIREKDRELKEKIIEFNKTEPELAIELVKQAIRERNKHRELLRDIYEATKKLVEKIEKDELLNFVDFSKSDEETYSKRHVIGIDGSFQVVGGFGKRYYIMTNAVIVELPHGLDTKVHEFKQRYSGIKIYTYDTSYEEELVKSIAEDIMMVFETRAIDEATRGISGSIIFLDGPAVDPPREPLDESQAFLAKMGVIDYIGYRANVLTMAHNNNNIVVGYVKSSRTDKLLKEVFVSRYGNDCKNELSKFRGDEELAYSILWSITKRIKNERKYPYLGPFEAPYKGDNIYKKYLDAGVKIYYFYGINRWHNKAFRAEIPVPSNIDLDDKSLSRIAETIYKSILANTLPGNRYPLPVILAHEKCSIRRGAAELIYETIISRVLSDIFYQKGEIDEALFKLNILLSQPSKF